MKLNIDNYLYIKIFTIGTQVQKIWKWLYMY